MMRDPPMGDRRWVPARASTRRDFARARRSHEDARGESRARPRPSRVHAASRVRVVAVRPGRPLFARNNIPGRGGFQGLAMTAGATCRKAASRWASAFRDASGALAGETARVARHAHHARAWSRAASGAIGIPPRDSERPGPRLGATSAVERPRRDRRAFAAHSAAIDGALDHEPVNPFTIVNDELGAISARMRQAVTSEVPALATAAEYFFKVGAEGKRMRPTVLLLLASALTDVSAAGAASNVVDHAPAHVVPGDVRRRQQRLAEITELIHVASLLHDDVLDGSATRRGLRALNLEVGNKLAILAGDFLLARASVTLASLRNVEVIELLSRVLEHLVTGEVMQMTAKAERLTSFDHYFQKTYFKTASLIANSAKAIVLLGGHDTQTAELAYDYGRHLGLAFQFQDDVLDFVGSGSVLGKPTLGDLREGIATAPVLFAAEEFPALTPLIERRFKHSGDVERAADWVRASRGVERTKELAREHSAEAVRAIDALPPIDCPHALRCRRGLKELAHMAVDRIK